LWQPGNFADAVNRTRSLLPYMMPEWFPGVMAASLIDKAFSFHRQ
jgi:hypothetical protein